MADPDSPRGWCIRYRDAFFAAGRVIEWAGIDLIEVRGGRLCRNAVYSSAHAARVLDQPARRHPSLGRHDHSSWSSRTPSLTYSERRTPSRT